MNQLLMMLCQLRIHTMGIINPKRNGAMKGVGIITQVPGTCSVVASNLSLVSSLVCTAFHIQ